MVTTLFLLHLSVVITQHWYLVLILRGRAFSYALTGCGDIRITGPGGGTILEVDLTTDDLNALKLNRNLARSAADTYIDVRSGNGFVALDSSGTLASLSATALPVQVGNYIPDTTPPEVSDNGFTEFDLDSGQFTIVFNEPIDGTSIMAPGALIFQHSSDVSQDSDIFQVQSLTSPVSDGLTITFTLPQSELGRLKLTPRVCSSVATCWLTIEQTGGFVTDMAGVRVAPLQNALFTSQRFVQSFIDDTTGPVLDSFVLNMTSRELVLTFDEPVDFTTLNISLITLLGSPGASGDASYTLTSENLLSGAGE